MNERKDSIMRHIQRYAAHSWIGQHFEAGGCERCGQKHDSFTSDYWMEGLHLRVFGCSFRYKSLSYCSNLQELNDDDVVDGTLPSKEHDLHKDIDSPNLRAFTYILASIYTFPLEISPLRTWCDTSPYGSE